jgi:hypothetical protein
VRAAQSQYLPSLSLRAGVGGFTQQTTDISQAISQRQANATQSVAQCANQAQLYQRVGLPFTQDCNAFAFTPDQAAALRSANRAFPFQFTRTPTT